MSKPYLSIIVPVINDTRLDSMLSIMNADYLLQEAMFDYELLIMVPEADSAYPSLLKFASAIHNAKCIKVTENSISGLLRSGLMEANGVIRAISFKNDFRFLENFPSYIPLFKESEVVMGPKWSSSVSRFVPQFISTLVHSSYQFQIMNEDVVPVLNSQIRSDGWEFFSEAHWRLSLAGKNIESVDAVPLLINSKIFDLQLLKDAATIRIHYLRLLIRNLLWLFYKKIIGVYQSLISKYY